MFATQRIIRQSVLHTLALDASRLLRGAAFKRLADREAFLLDFKGFLLERIQGLFVATSWTLRGIEAPESSWVVGDLSELRARIELENLEHAYHHFDFESTKREDIHVPTMQELKSDRGKGWSAAWSCRSYLQVCRLENERYAWRVLEWDDASIG
jgi:hypothetical protein